LRQSYCVFFIVDKKLILLLFFNLKHSYIYIYIYIYLLLGIGLKPSGEEAIK